MQAVSIFADDAPQLKTALKRFFKEYSEPMAIFSVRSEYAVTALTMARQLGKRVPADIAILSRDYSPIYAYCEPSLAGYQSRFDALARAVLSQIRLILRGGHISKLHQRRLAQFTSGESFPRGRFGT